MKPFLLVETTTRDKLIHQGIFYKPEKPGKIALLWIPGLTSTFYGDITIFNEIIDQIKPLNWGFACFNNRGHDIMTGIRKIDKRKPKGYSHITIGAGMEIFTDCIFDIDAGINFLVQKGFSEIIIIGHSTGANKVCFYAGQQKSKKASYAKRFPNYIYHSDKIRNNILGFILACPIADRLGPNVNPAKRQKDLEYMQSLINQGKGDELIAGFTFFPLTPKRFLSLFQPNSPEDVFDYGDSLPHMTRFSQTTKPLLLIFAGKDEYADRSMKKIKSVFDEYQHSTNYNSIIIPNAVHGFDHQENEFVKTIVVWIKSVPI
jgi:pimeloyl-ACP methyl ester carboxylesterase